MAHARHIDNIPGRVPVISILQAAIAATRKGSKQVKEKQDAVAWSGNRQSKRLAAPRGYTGRERERRM